MSQNEYPKLKGIFRFSPKGKLVKETICTQAETIDVFLLGFNRSVIQVECKYKSSFISI